MSPVACVRGYVVSLHHEGICLQSGRGEGGINGRSGCRVLYPMVRGVVMGRRDVVRMMVVVIIVVGGDWWRWRGVSLVEPVVCLVGLMFVMVKGEV